MESELIQRISVVGINERAVEALVKKGTSSQHAVIELDLSERPNPFWTAAFYSCWGDSLERDAKERGEFAISKGSSFEDQRDQMIEVFNLKNRLRSPRETWAPWFKHPNAGRENEPSRIGFNIGPVVRLYGSISEYMQRLLKAVDEANAVIAEYPPLVAELEKLRKEEATREANRLAAETVIDKVRQSLASRTVETLAAEAVQL